jgi:radical SAM superfamily enzyme YgiQ (UPF0313 family)
LSVPFAEVQNSQTKNDTSKTGYILQNFYKPYLTEEWETISQACNANQTYPSPILIGITIPFPGCLAGAMICAESAKNHFGKNSVIAAGGGYINTELRYIETKEYFNYVDFLSFDRGYGSLDAILKKIETKNDDDTPLYKTIFRSSKTNALIRSEIISDEPNTVSKPDKTGKEIDTQSVKTIFPDYSGVDFHQYICPVDDTNPMHRLWSDGRWLKAYLAHGCYWHSCAFCDVTLDYIKCYEPIDVENLFRHLVGQAKKTGVRGVHLVDEACPPQSLMQLALLNRDAGLPLVFWGNIRFEKDFTPDAAAILAAGGLLGISAGIEVASEKGFKRLGKGISLNEVVSSCAAFKESGILTHAYLIYGYWDEDDQEIIDSAEILRQLFSAGLLDSAFWHKFVLTRHSRIYAEHKRSLHKDLKMVTDTSNQGLVFNLNDLSFEGEEKFNRYTAPLDQLLAAWMQNDTAAPVESVFPFKVPVPSVSPDLVLQILNEYAHTRDRDRKAIPKESEKVLFLGSNSVITKNGKTITLRWRWHLTDFQLKTETEDQAVKIASLLTETSSGMGIDATALYGDFKKTFGEINVPKTDKTEKAWKALRCGGLALFA